MSNAPERVLTFLTPDEVQALGGLPAEAIAGVIEGAELTPTSLKPNRIFVEFMHMTIREAGPLDPGLQEAARHKGDGWVYVVDLRTPRGPGGNVPPEDVIGGFEVHGGQIVPDSYHANDGHQVFSENGLVVLPSRLRAVFVARLRPSTGTA